MSYKRFPLLPFEERKAMFENIKGVERVVEQDTLSYKKNLEEIKPRLRSCDKIHLLACGEFEDLLPIKLVLRTLEYELKNISILEKEKLNEDIPRVKFLEEVFKTRGMHEFKKVEFAQMVKLNIKTDEDISPEIRDIINEIKK